MPEAEVFTVLGSGFGMYGYLPALMELGLGVALPLRYQSTLSTRVELSEFTKQVIWCSGVEDALARSSGAVVALRPADQALWIPRLTQMSNIRQLILEKPLAPTPAQAASLLAALDHAEKHYRVGYTFRFMPWAQQLRQTLAAPPESITLDWGFLAHHYRAGLVSWKRFDPEGGGALRFYGIHVIALLADFGYDDVSVSAKRGPSDEETEAWEATFTGPGRCPLKLTINSRAGAAFFRIVAHNAGQPGRTLTDLSDPFATPLPNSAQVQDARVGVLGQLCRSLDEPDAPDAERQKAIVALWACVEQKSQRV